ncbi:MAG: hypothetical protein H7Z42_22175 [Roseiflexaceae bacterium]|nr:hypothetical protein [Roseiflexaceae bacterium]
MYETPPNPKPEELARWLLTSAGGAPHDLEELSMVAVDTYEQLRAHLATFLGFQGFDALWDRTLHLVRRTFPWEHHDVIPATPSAHQLDLMLRGRDAAEAQAIVLAIFTQFLALLFTFIGAGLGLRLLQQHWLALLAPRATDSRQEAQQ